MNAIDTPRGVILRQDIADKLTEDSAILEWLATNVTHLEHGGPKLEDGYWPQGINDVDPYPNFIGLDLREYVLARMRGEVGMKAAPAEDIDDECLCPACNGSGEGPCDEVLCSACHGTGEAMRRAA